MLGGSGADDAIVRFVADVEEPLGIFRRGRREENSRLAAPVALCIQSTRRDGRLSAVSQLSRPSRLKLSLSRGKGRTVFF